MKNRLKYLLYICNTVLIGLIIFNIISYDIENDEIEVLALESQDGKYISYLEIDNIKKDLLSSVVEEEVKEEKSVETKEIKPVVEEKKVEQKPEVEVPKEVIKEEPPKVDVTPKVEDTTVSNNVIETLIGNLVGYGPDCSGCTSMKTASGKYIGDGNIYYNDATYGKVRIIAGDYSYPFGTIVRISNVDFYNDEPFYAMVLDRGGNIGKNRKFLFDLLFASEQEAYRLGTEINIKYEIMRLGY